jgi:hypothetical protein
MIPRLIAVLFLVVLAAPAWSQSLPEPEAPPVTEAAEAPPEKILVVGQRPGPGLWKVSKGEHVMWVFGTYGPLPKGMEWRSQQVEAILAQSQEYLTPPSAGASVGFFRSLTLLPHVIGLKRNPDGAKLKDLLPADVYARWEVLKAKYIGDDDGIERERPLFAAEQLFRSGLTHAGLSNGSEVYAAIDKIVKKNNIKKTSTGIKLEISDPRQMIKDYKKSTLDDVACFSKTLDRLETDIDAMRVRANAWAKGDLAVIEKLDYTDRDTACGNAIRNAEFVKSKPEFRDMEARMQEAWLTAVDKSMTANASTFAIVPLHKLLDPKGMMAALQARGYTVEKPE